MIELIKKLEQAEEGSRELDASFGMFIGWSRVKPCGEEAVWVNPETMRVEELPHFTTSLDAILREVPEGCGWEITTAILDSGVRKAAARIWPDGSDFPDRWCSSFSPALALCIAVLKARHG